ncbi:MAG: adenylate/guanylate cyclase domain-containing protein, partial [Myxococcota bacterium]
MSTMSLKQRLFAILAADAVGYSRLMAGDAHETVATLDAARAVFHAQVALHQGRIIDTAGDSVLAVFDTAIGAVEAARTIQSVLREAAEPFPEERRMRFRIGIHLGDVLEKTDGTVYGDGVNIAARLQTLAPAGGVTLSEAVRSTLRGKLAVQLQDLGEQAVKNISSPVRVFQIVDGTAAVASAGELPSPVPAPAPAVPASPVPLPDRPSIIVLPFQNMSGDPEQEYFADGITEDIITDVSNIEGLFVIARNTAFTFKRQNVDVKEVGRRLGVRHVLEGSVRKAGTKVRINVQLIDAKSGGHLWAERFDRDLDNIFALQDEVTTRIVASLEGRLGQNVKMPNRERRTVDAQAYDLLLRARNMLGRYTPAATTEGKALAQQALAIDPKLARAFALLSIVETASYTNGWSDSSALERARDLAQQARDTDPNDAICWFVMSNALMWSRRLDEAAFASQRGIEIDSNSAEAHGPVGSGLHCHGMHEAALEAYERALSLDPYYDVWLHARGRVEFALGLDAAAEATFQRRLDLTPNSDVSRAYLASLFGHLGRIEEAKAMWNELMMRHPHYTPALTQRVLPYRDPAPLERFLEGLRQAG